MTTRRRRTRSIAFAVVRVVGLAVLAAAVVLPQWIVASRYRPPTATDGRQAEFLVSVERGQVDDYLDVPAVPSAEGRALLPVTSARSASDIELKATPGDLVRSGDLLAVASQLTDEGGSAARPIFLLGCDGARPIDVQPGEHGALVTCLQVTLAQRGTAIAGAESGPGVLGPSTQRALAALYSSVGFDAPVTEDDLDVKRIDAEGDVVAAEQALALVSPDDGPGRELARLRLLSAAAQRDRLRDRSGIRLVAADFVVAASPEVTLDGVEASEEGEVAVSVSWGGRVLDGEVSSATWRAVGVSVAHRLVAGTSTTGLTLLSSESVADGTRRVRFGPGADPVDGPAFDRAVSGEAGGAMLRFVERTSGGPVVSVPLVAVRRDGDVSFVVAVGSGGDRTRVPVSVVDRIAGRAILAGDVLSGVDDVAVS